MPRKAGLKSTGGAFGSDSGALADFMDKCADGLDVLYTSIHSSIDAEPTAAYSTALRHMIRMICFLAAADRIPDDRKTAEPIHKAAQVLIDQAENRECAYYETYEEAAGMAYEASGFGIFKSGDIAINQHSFTSAVCSLLRPSPEAPMERLFFSTMPLSWLGCVYQYLLAFRPTDDGDHLEINRSFRKGRGVYFTPRCLITYIIESVLAPLVDSHAGMFDRNSPVRLRVIDPSMGGGDFLTCAVDFLSERSESGRDDIAANCVFGVDVDQGAVEISRFCVWAASMFADGISEAVNSHLICANALGARHADELEFDWRSAFPDVFASGGFDALVGNPPYIASKNGLGPASTAGQSDSYLMFLSTIMDNKLVKPGGMLSMVLPDPMLVRENAAPIRRRLMNEWTMLSLLHISGAFPDAMVANVAPICRNLPPSGQAFKASRIEKAADRRSFFLRPGKTASELAYPVRWETVVAQDRCEILYLLEDGPFGEIIRQIHGPNTALSIYQPPFAPLRRLNTKVIYRGEEVGKAIINRDNGGDMPILLGGQSINPYEIEWEGRKINRSRVKKPIERYHSTKILVQKSAPRIIAALDRVDENHPGYVFPQSVYAIELQDTGMDPVYLLCILNSQVMNEYIWCTATAYKLEQPQIELEDIRALPIRCVSFTTETVERETDAARGLEIFEKESVRGTDSAPFPELVNFVVECLTSEPEKSDVVHDLLVHLGRQMIDLTGANRKSPDSDITSRMKATRSAIETIVWRLYSSDPSQMSLPW